MATSCCACRDESPTRQAHCVVATSRPRGRPRWRGRPACGPAQDRSGLPQHLVAGPDSSRIETTYPVRTACIPFSSGLAGAARGSSAGARPWAPSARRPARRPSSAAAPPTPTRARCAVEPGRRVSRSGSVDAVESLRLAVASVSAALGRRRRARTSNTSTPRRAARLGAAPPHRRTRPPPLRPSWRDAGASRASAIAAIRIALAVLRSEVVGRPVGQQIKHRTDDPA